MRVFLYLRGPTMGLYRELLGWPWLPRKGETVTVGRTDYNVIDVAWKLGTNAVIVYLVQPMAERSNKIARELEEELITLGWMNSEQHLLTNSPQSSVPAPVETSLDSDQRP